MVEFRPGPYLYSLAFFVLCAQKAFAHKNHHHAEVQEVPPPRSEENHIAEISDLYKFNVKPLLQQKCFDCHSQNTNYPWYYEIPGVKQLIDGDIGEAQRHLDFGDGFPFLGHGSPREDLNAVRDVVRDNSMPPIRYWLLHWDSRLTDEESRVILEWVEHSQAIFDSRK